MMSYHVIKYSTLPAGCDVAEKSRIAQNEATQDLSKCLHRFLFNSYCNFITVAFSVTLITKQGIRIHSNKLYLYEPH